jgi:ATP-dependent RNA helicase RhlE
MLYYKQFSSVPLPHRGSRAFHGRPELFVMPHSLLFPRCAVWPSSAQADLHNFPIAHKPPRLSVELRCEHDSRGFMHFTELKLIEPILRAVQAEGYNTPTPIQAQAIPHVLVGRDLIGCAQTGTGKTAAFALPILQRLNEMPAPAHAGRPRGGIRVLVLSPTRELATQIGDSFATYGRHLKWRHLVVFGGVGQGPQVDALRRGTDILVATPGRLLDLMQQGFIKLDTIEIFVLDEADRMLDMGFIHDVRRVVAALPTQRQTLLFSATMAPEIEELAQRILVRPVKVEVTPQATTVEKIAQSVYFVEKRDKRALLEFLMLDDAAERVLVFTRTKHGANKVAEGLNKADIGAEAIHGNKSQSAREKALANFKSGAIRVLVATDIAARGLDIEEVTHVINYDLPDVPESYVHRIGRTARAGASGVAFSFCDADERDELKAIQKLTRQQIPIVTDHPYVPAFDLTRGVSAHPAAPEERRTFNNGRGGRQNSGPARSSSTPSGGRQPQAAGAHNSGRAANTSTTGSRGTSTGGSGRAGDGRGRGFGRSADR